MAKILIAEDDYSQAFLYQSVFEASGLSAVVASTKQELLDLARRELPDLMLVDIMLRHENGLDAIEELVADEATKDIPVFVFTNTNKEEYKVRAMHLGVDAYIVKLETTPQAMAEKIKQFLNKSNG